MYESMFPWNKVQEQYAANGGWGHINIWTYEVFQNKNFCDWDDSNRDDNDDAGKFPERGRQHRGYDLLTHWTMEQILEYFAIDTLRYFMF